MIEFQHRFDKSFVIFGVARIFVFRTNDSDVRLTKRGGVENSGTRAIKLRTLTSPACRERERERVQIPLPGRCKSTMRPLREIHHTAFPFDLSNRGIGCTGWREHTQTQREPGLRQSRVYDIVRLL